MYADVFAVVIGFFVFLCVSGLVLWIDFRNGLSMNKCFEIPAFPSLIYSFNRGNTEGTNSSKFVFVNVFDFLCLCKDWFCGLT